MAGNYSLTNARVWAKQSIASVDAADTAQQKPDLVKGVTDTRACPKKSTGAKATHKDPPNVANFNVHESAMALVVRDWIVA